MSEIGMCPCCGQPAFLPDLGRLIAERGLRPAEAKVLTAVWDGWGMPVTTSKIFDTLYADDINGGPSPTRMYAALNRALGSIRTKLSGTGVEIVEARYGKGWQLALALSDGPPG